MRIPKTSFSAFTPDPAVSKTAGAKTKEIKSGLSRKITDRIDLSSLKNRLDPRKVSKSEAALWMDKLQDLTVPCPEPLIYIEARDLYLPYAPAKDGKDTLLSFKDSLDLLEEGKTVNFKHYCWLPTRAETPDGDEYYLTTFRPDHYSNGEVFPLSSFEQLKAFSRKVTQEPKVARLEALPKPEKILAQWEENAKAEPFDGKMIHQPRAEKEGKLTDISYSEAGERLSRKQPVFFQPMICNEIPDGYDYYYQYEPLGSHQDKGTAVAGCWVKDLKDLKNYYKIERLSTPSLEAEWITTPEEFLPAQPPRPSFFDRFKPCHPKG